MMPERLHTDWRDSLPAVRGKLERDGNIARYTWFRTGGPADILFRPADEDDLASFLSALDPDIPVTVIGVGSNMLVRDGGVRGVVVRLGKPFAEIRIDGERLLAGAGATDIAVANKAAEAGLGGLEFLIGIPGTIGGGAVMNAGAYGSEFSDVLEAVTLIRRNGHREERSAGDIRFSYRRTDLPEEAIVTSVVFRTRPADQDTIRTRMKNIQDAREDTQPLRTRTGGSTFKNPADTQAWKLIEQAGCRGLKLGDAQVSEKHCNFLINTGDATSADLEALGEDVRRRVREKTGITLDWEIRRIGTPAGKEAADDA